MTHCTYWTCLPLVTVHADDLFHTRGSFSTFHSMCHSPCDFTTIHSGRPLTFFFFGLDFPILPSKFASYQDCVEKHNNLQLVIFAIFFFHMIILISKSWTHLFIGVPLFWEKRFLIECHYFEKKDFFNKKIFFLFFICLDKFF